MVAGFAAYPAVMLSPNHLTESCSVLTYLKAIGEKNQFSCSGIFRNKTQRKLLPMGPVDGHEEHELNHSQVARDPVICVCEGTAGWTHRVVQPV